MVTWTQVGVEAFPLQHDEQRTPAQQHSRTQKVFQDGRHRHPPAPAVGLHQSGHHRCGGGGRDRTVELEWQQEATPDLRFASLTDVH